MPIESVLDTYNYNFNHPIVRDLAWSIASPPMVNVKSNVLISTDWLAQQYTDYLPRLFALDVDPAPLLNFIRPATRLGLYFEQLWHFFFTDNPNFDVLLANTQVRDDHFTYGEFDFIVKDNTTNQVTHFEVAVKFYLGYPSTNNEPPLWYGANMKDRFDIKFNHMLEHQIKLGHQEAAQRVLREHNINIDDEKIILKGRLYQAHPALELTNQLLPNSCNWRWITHHHFKKESIDYRWYQIMKPNYLATRTKTELDIYQHQTMGEKKPLQLLRYNNQKEAERLILVPDEWLAKIKLDRSKQAKISQV
ncbi:DUF1853 family protein [Moritella sp. 28]|uniref:DUF1853 family protein n=1 Tax=Moritella sp. 28 TaxID=2746232 RepID=UPI001BA8158C|nr:DUF1853 family protein [Moritella sp. 28]QUM84975.1 DUF1853 family protein [Moritella sp. 28]